MTITSGTSGTGNGVVNVTVSANPTTDSRTGTLTIAGKAVSVRVDGSEPVPCTFDINPASASYSKDAATGSFAVTAPSHCGWNAVSDAGWIGITAGSGTGHGTVSYAVERNREPTTRTGTIVVGGKTFTVTQLGDAGVCEYSVAPVEFTPCMATPDVLTATINTQEGCTWTVESTAGWIDVLTARSGSGSSTIRFDVSDNWEAPRHGVVEVRWPTPTAGQNLHVFQAGCTYAVSASTLNFAASGGTGRFEVFQQANPISCGGPMQNACMWSANASVSWITVNTSMPQFGDNPVSFTVAPNPGTAPRTGTIRVRDKTVQITQAGR